MIARRRSSVTARAAGYAKRNSSCLMMTPDSKLSDQTMIPLTSHAFSVPVVETERLVLRGHRVDDYADCFDLWTDESVTRFIGGRPSTQEEVWARLLRYAGLWALIGFGYWVVTEK